MKTRRLRIGWTIFLSVMILLLAALAYLLYTRANLLRAGYLDPAPGVLFYDDFSHTISGWDVQQGVQGSSGYDFGQYVLKVADPSLDLWGTAWLDFADVQIEVDAVRTAGPESASMGVICRYQDADNFYFAVITSHGYAGIGAYEEGGFRLLSGDGLQSTASVKGGSQVNHLRFDCVGSTLTLYVNGYQALMVEDARLTSGDVGLIAGSLEQAGVEVAFDDFVVFEP
jgi:hypothetical protein